MKTSNFKIVTNLIFFSIFLLFTSISLFQYLTGKHIVNKSFEYEASLLQIDFVSSDYGIIKVIKNIVNESIIRLIVSDQFKSVNFNFDVNNNFVNYNENIYEIEDKYYLAGKDLPINFYSQQDKKQFIKIFKTNKDILKDKLLELIQNKLKLIKKSKRAEIIKLNQLMINNENIKKYIMNNAKDKNKFFLENCESPNDIVLNYVIKDNAIEDYTIGFNCSEKKQQLTENQSEIQIEIRLVPELYKYNVNRDFFNNAYIIYILLSVIFASLLIFINYKTLTFLNR